MARSIVTFSHIPKTGGTTLITLLRRQFGLGHVDVVTRDPGPHHEALETDLSVDMKVHPWAKSLCAHCLKPYVDLGKYASRLSWYTMLRDPINRYLSAFLYERNVMGNTKGFAEWMRTSRRENFQVYWMTGEQNLQKAIDCCGEKMKVVGLLERYDESLLLFRSRLGLDQWKLNYDRPSNKSKDREGKEMVEAAYEEHRDEVHARNALDIALYEFVCRELWPRYISEYGGKEKLGQDVQATFGPSAGLSFAAGSRQFINRAYRNLVYKPIALLDRIRKARAKQQYPWTSQEALAAAEALSKDRGKG